MELRQLKYFIEVARQLHFRKASEVLYISQSALSQQIQLLEEEIGVDLFDRVKRIKHRSVALTPEGQFFLKEARSIVRKSEVAIRDVRKMASKEDELRIGFYSLAMRKWVVEIANRISSVRPNLDLKLEELLSVESVQEALVDHKIDIGLTLRPLINEALASRAYREDYLSIVMSDRNPLHSKEVVYLADMKDENWVIINKPLHPFYDYIEKLCLSRGFSREKHIVQEASSHEVLCSLVSLGKGVAFMPSQYDLSNEIGLVAKKVLVDPESKAEIKVEHAIAWRKQKTSKELMDLIDLI